MAAKLILTAHPNEMQSAQLASETARWLKENEESRLWELELQFRRVTPTLPRATAEQAWSDAMKKYFEGE